MERRRHMHYRDRTRVGGGFTLVELLVVISIIVILVAVLLPTFRQAREIAHNATCQSNLNKIGTGMATHTANHNRSMPRPLGWIGAMASQGLGDVLVCPKDDVEEDPEDASLEDVYILQYPSQQKHTYFASYLSQALDSGTVSDQQLRVWYPAKGMNNLPEKWVSNGYVPDSLDENQAFVGLGNHFILSCGVLITFNGREIEVTSWPNSEASGGDNAGGSRHWLMRGPGTPLSPLPLDADSAADEDDEELLRLWSPSAVPRYTMDPRSPLTLGRETASYGMNAMVQGRDWSSRQILVTDACETVINVGSGNNEDDLEEVLQPRHFRTDPDDPYSGTLNVLTADGSVRSRTLDELQREYDESGHGRWNFK